uniref:Uncharacterized protein LOC111134280 isoform X2 n=1 Tax=Crassostrea virginica TaxID=6565 RepID=A0A8B8EGX1_CRAVI|nr:uncharacterized protein LOC111134280 isoform X2 [Crassostrea virginica]
MSPELGPLQLFVFYVLNHMFTTGNICSSQGEPLKCCVNYQVVNGSCQECPSGRFGHNCEYLCATNYYGRFCVEVCNCSQLQGYYCHHVSGCTKNVTDRNAETNNAGGANAIWPWILLTVIVLLCGTGIGAATVVAQKRGYFRRNAKVTMKNRPITPYSIKDLSYNADETTEDTQYATVVRSGTKVNYNIDQEASGSQPNGNIYSTNILCHSRYDVLQFHHKAETILKSSEEDQYDFTVEKQMLE